MGLLALRCLITLLLLLLLFAARLLLQVPVAGASLAGVAGWLYVRCAMTWTLLLHVNAAAAAAGAGACAWRLTGWCCMCVPLGDGAAGAGQLQHAAAGGDVQVKGRSAMQGLPF
jgi:hypothetical protein